MPKILNQLNSFIFDLKNAGWFFRIWIFLAAVCAIVGFTALIEISTESGTAAREKDWSVWVESVSSLTFPDFEVSVPNAQNAFQSVKCYHDSSTLVATTGCANNTALLTCIKVLGSTQTALSSSQNTIGTGSNKINCAINTVNTNPNTANSIVTFTFPGARLDGAEISVKPTQNAWILMRPIVISGIDGNSFSAFTKQLVYHSSELVPGQYIVSLVIGSFHVIHYEQADTYNGWLAVADIGGFAYFLLIIHAFIMIVVGIFLQNNSNLLLGKSPSPTSAHSPGL